MNITLESFDIIIIFFTCALCETIKPLLFKSKFIKRIYPLIVLFVALFATIGYAFFNKLDYYMYFMKGFINGAFSSWGYDLIISKFKKKD